MAAGTGSSSSRIEERIIRIIRQSFATINAARVLEPGEPAYDTTSHSLRIGDGSTTFENLPEFQSVSTSGSGSSGRAVGEIITTATNVAPIDRAIPCDGRLIDKASNPEVGSLVDQLRSYALSNGGSNHPFISGPPYRPEETPAAGINQAFVPDYRYAFLRSLNDNPQATTTIGTVYARRNVDFIQERVRSNVVRSGVQGGTFMDNLPLIQTSRTAGTLQLTNSVIPAHRHYIARNTQNSNQNSRNSTVSSLATSARGQSTVTPFTTDTTSPNYDKFRNIPVETRRTSSNNIAVSISVSLEIATERTIERTSTDYEMIVSDSNPDRDADRGITSNPLVARRRTIPNGGFGVGTSIDTYDEVGDANSVENANYPINVGVYTWIVY